MTNGSASVTTEHGLGALGQVAAAISSHAVQPLVSDRPPHCLLKVNQQSPYFYQFSELTMCRSLGPGTKGGEKGKEEEDRNALRKLLTNQLRGFGIR